MKKEIMLNPNCSTIVCKLPTVSTIKKAERICKKIEASNLDDKTKEITKEILVEWSYNEYRLEVDTASYPNDAIDCFIEKADEFKKQFKKLEDFPDLYCEDNSGGGGNWGYTEASWRIARLYAFGKFTKESAMKFDKRLWEDGQDPILVDECEQCLKENKINKECKEYVRRVVGECKGIHHETPYAILTKMENEVDHATKSKL